MADLQKPTRLIIENSYHKISMEIEGSDHSLDELMSKLIIPTLNAMGYSATEYFEEEDG